MIVSNSYKNKNVAIFGLGKAGMSTIKSLHAGGAHIFAWDDNTQARASLEVLNLKNVIIQEPEEYQWQNIHALLLSPGIPLTHPEPHRVVTLAHAANCPIICDIELLYQEKGNSKFIGITGTNGKSTTTTLLGHILKEAKLPTEIGGNLGIPALDLSSIEDGYYVIEMSSYQLDLIDQTHFDTAVWLNISPDHLDRHGGIEGYVQAKRHIFNHQNPHDLAVIGIDDAHSRKVYEELKNAGETGTIIPISVKEKLVDGISIIDGILYDHSEEGDDTVELGTIKFLPGTHNSQNIAAAYAVAKFLGVGKNTILDAIHSFKGLRHRMQYVKEINGVTYINDSKATNADAVEKALATFKNIHWIVGGVAKEGGLTSLTEYFPRIKHAYLIGEAEEAFASTLENHVNFTRCGDLQKAVDLARNNAENGDVVLLSPACASFDQWPNFEARGDAFCELVG